MQNQIFRRRELPPVRRRRLGLFLITAAYAVAFALLAIEVSRIMIGYCWWLTIL